MKVFRMSTADKLQTTGSRSSTTAGKCEAANYLICSSFKSSVLVIAAIMGLAYKDSPVMG